MVLRVLMERDQVHVVKDYFECMKFLFIFSANLLKPVNIGQASCFTTGTKYIHVKNQET